MQRVPKNTPDTSPRIMLSEDFLIRRLVPPEGFPTRWTVPSEDFLVRWIVPPEGFPTRWTVPSEDFLVRGPFRPKASWSGGSVHPKASRSTGMINCLVLGRNNNFM